MMNVTSDMSRPTAAASAPPAPQAQTTLASSPVRPMTDRPMGATSTPSTPATPYSSPYNPPAQPAPAKKVEPLAKPPPVPGSYATPSTPTTPPTSSDPSPDWANPYKYLDYLKTANPAAHERMMIMADPQRHYDMATAAYADQMKMLRGENARKSAQDFMNSIMGWKDPVDLTPRV